MLIAGERVVLLCDIQHDGRVSWKTTLPNNSMSFEEVWKKNQTQNVIEALKKSVEAHAALRAALQAPVPFVPPTQEMGSMDFMSGE